MAASFGIIRFLVSDDNLELCDFAQYSATTFERSEGSRFLTSLSSVTAVDQVAKDHISKFSLAFVFISIADVPQMVACTYLDDQ